jgi:hypothetical protein
MLTALYSIVMAPVLRAFFILLGSTTGVWIRFEKVRGDFFSYKACLDGVKLEIPDHLSCEVKTCSLEFSVLDFSLKTLIVSNVYLEGARLEYNHASDKDLLPPTLPPFLIRNLQIKESSVIFSDRSPKTLTLKAPTALTFHLDDYRCEALHSQYLLFNAIFTSQMVGRLEEAPFSMAYREEGEKGLSQWLVQGLPTQRLAPFVQGKLDLIEKSSLNISVSNEWLVNYDDITMTVQILIFDLLNFRSPALLPVPTKLLADALSVFINHQINNKVQEIPVSFQFKLRKDNFLDLKDINISDILTAFADALTKAILEKSLKNQMLMKDMGLLGLDTLLDIKKLFDKY